MIILPDQRQLLKHLTGCLDCSDTYRFRKHLDKFMDEKAKHHDISS